MKTNRRGGVLDKINIPLSGSLAHMWQDKKLEWAFPSLRERGGGGWKKGMYEIGGQVGGGGFIKEQGLKKNLKLYMGVYESGTLVRKDKGCKNIYGEH